MIGRRLGHYRIIEQIGAGGMGVVYRARDERLDRDVAIKVLPPEALADPDARRRFQREALALSRVSHPHIETIHDFHHEGDVDFLVTEFVDGETLAQRLARSPLPEPVWVNIALQMAQALQAAHGRRLAHRDLKPGNVMLTRDGHVKVLDFGLARLLSGPPGATTAGSGQSSEAGRMAGTLTYMAPEQLLGAPADHRADLWSLGVIMFEMATGTLPFRDPFASALVYRIAHDPVPAPRSVNPRLSEGFERVILSCLEKRPEDRFQSAEELATALHEPAHARARGMVRRRRSRWVKRLALAGIVGLVALLALLLLPRRAALAPQRVAVAVFANGTGDPALDPVGRMAADWVTQGIARTALVDVVPTAVVLQSSLAAANGAPPGRADMVRLLAEDTGAALVVTGSYYLQADSVRFQTRISDAQRGEVVQVVDPISAPRHEPLLAVEKLRQRVMAALAGQVNPRLSSWVRVTSQPPSFEAYQEYVEGEERFVRADWRGAIEHFYRAAARDSGYTYPLLQACVAHLNLGEPARIDSITRILGRSADRLAPLDRRVLDWLRAGLEGDLQASYDAARRAAEIAPGSVWTYQRALQAMLLGRPREVVEVLSRVHPGRGAMRGWAPYWNLLTDGYHMLGRHERELTEARRARRAYPDLMTTLELEARAQAALGRTSAVDQLLDEAVALSPEPGGAADGVFVNAARELRAHGHDGAARAVLERLIRRLRDSPREGLSPAARRTLAGALYFAGHWDEAAGLFEPLHASDPGNVHLLGFVTALAARRGDGKAAFAGMERLETLAEPYLRGANTYWQAEVAAILGDRPRAVQLLHRAFREGQPVPVKAHNDPELESLRGDPEYRRLVAMRR